MYRNRTKSNHRRIAAGAGVVAALLAICTGCSPFAAGSGDNDNVLTVWTAYAGTEKSLLEELADQFEQTHPDMNVKISVIPEDVWVTKLQTAVLAKDSPDIALVYTNGYVGSFQPLNDTLYADLDLADYNAPVLDGACGFDGKIYCMGGNVGALTLAYNKDIFTAAGIPFPSTEEPMTIGEYASLARQLSAAGATWGGSVPVPTYWLDSALFLDDTGRTVDLLTPEYIEVFDVLSGLVKDGISPGQAQLDATGSDEAAKALFLDGEVAMTLWEGSLSEGIPESIDLGLAPTPVPDGGDYWVSRWTNPYGIPVGAKHPDEATEFLSLFGTTGQEIESTRGNLPVRLAEGDAFAALGEPESQFRAIVERSRPTVFNPNSGAWTGVIEDAYSSVLLGDRTVEEALAEAEPKAQQLLDTTWQTFDASLPK